MADLPLVLLPGTLCDHRVWDAMLAQWGPGAPATVVTPSLRGARSAAAMAASLLPHLPPRFAVMGFSLGGIVALELAAQAVDRVAALALVATNARPDPVENRALRRAALAKARTGGLAAHVRADLWPRYVAPSRLDDEGILELVVQMAEAVGTDAYEEQADIASQRADSLPRLARITVPALLVGGDEDGINPRDRQEEMAQRLPSARWVQLADVGHFVPLEAPAQLAAAAASWFRSLPDLQAR